MVNPTQNYYRPWFPRAPSRAHGVRHGRFAVPAAPGTPCAALPCRAGAVAGQCAEGVELGGATGPRNRAPERGRTLGKRFLMVFGGFNHEKWGF